MFKVSGLNPSSIGEVEIDMDASENANPVLHGADISLGISLESSESVAAQIDALQSQTTSSTTENNQALVLSRPAVAPKVDIVLLAQRIIKNAFNFLASFSGNLNGGVEVVPLKAFEEWWRKFEGRIRADPGFLERDVGD